MTSNFVESAWARGLAGVFAVGLISGLAAMAEPARAQTTEWSTASAQQQAAVDPPGRVGRLAEVVGTAWLLHPAEGDWISALRNRPVTSGDRLSTERGSRLELQVGSTTLRLDGATDIEIGRIDDQAIQIRLKAGHLALRARNDEAARDLLVSTDDGSFSFLRSGSYRIESGAGRSEITVWAGQAVYNGPQSALNVYQGQRAEFWIDAGQRAQYSLGQPRFDTFAAWSEERDRLSDAAFAGRYVSPEMTGYQDLDRHGRWTEDPEYGALWAPHQVPSAWAPYSAGHWTWVSPWGWTWVDDAPWGFAPFHYGRWVVVNNIWWWAPGRRVDRPVYAPALVGWIGDGPLSVSLTIGGGRGVGWFPLAPREPYIPAYRYSRDHVHRVNGPHFRHPSDIDRVIQTTSVRRGIEYRNRKFHHGTTTIPIEAFTRRGDDHGRVRVDPRWRRGDVARDFDHLPGSAVSTVPAPSWLGQGRDRRGSPGGREAGVPQRDAGRPPGRESGPGTRRDGSVAEGWRRPEGRFEHRGEDPTRAARQFEDRGRPPIVGETGRGQAGGRPFFNPADPPPDARGNRGGRGGQQESQASPSVIQAPAAPVSVAPIDLPQSGPPRFERPGRTERPERAERPERMERPERVERPERFERPERPDGRLDRGEQPVGRPDRSMRPPVAERPPQPTAPPPMVQAPAPPPVQIPAQPNRQMEPPRMVQPPAEPSGRRTRDPREAPFEARASGDPRGAPGRATEQP